MIEDSIITFRNRKGKTLEILCSKIDEMIETMEDGQTINIPDLSDLTDDYYYVINK